jgi:outer membrane lipoprotein-sorting protein
LVERYTFSAVKVNPSLDPLTFDPENPAYGF